MGADVRETPSLGITLYLPLHVERLREWWELGHIQTPFELGRTFPGKWLVTSVEYDTESLMMIGRGGTMTIRLTPVFGDFL
jgi:hypothetical protein